MEEKVAVTALGALAQAMRLRVFRALVGSEPGGLTPSALSATLGVPPSTLSFHLKELTQASLVTQRREGRHLIYRADLARMTALLGYLTAHCCHGSDLNACAVPTLPGCATTSRHPED